MADLVVIPANTAGYDAIINSNTQELNTRLSSLFNADENFGDAVITDPAAVTAETLTDSTTGTPSNTINDVGAAYSQTALNNNFASLTDEINKLRADNVALRTVVVTLLAQIRQTGGVGILSD